jgi:ribose transport system ATP-binding protein
LIEDVGLTVESISKSFVNKTVLSAVSLHVAPGEICALLGQNGSGKSTLIKVLSGYHSPDPGGSISVGGEPLKFGSPAAAHRLGLRFVHQDLGLIPTLSVFDNIALGNGYPTSLGVIRGRLAARNAALALARIGTDVRPRQMVSELSPAQKTSVAIARALHPSAGTTARVLVLDEPTATLPAEEVQHLLAMMRATASLGVAVIFVTHHLDEALGSADKIVVLRDGVAVGTTAAGTTRRDELVKLLLGHEIDFAQKSTDGQANGTAPEAALVVDNVHAPPLRGVSLSAVRGEILGLYGLTGSGRDVLLGAIFGAVPRMHGTVSCCGVRLTQNDPRRSIRSGMSYLPADRRSSGAFMSLSARENITILGLRRYWSGAWLRRRPERKDAATWMSRVDVRPAGAQSAQLDTFSGGNQQKVLLAKWLRQESPVLLLDEPTQGVDIAAKDEIHKQLLAAARDGATILVSSTDEEELAAICDRVLVIQDGLIADEMTGERLDDVQLASAALRSHDLALGAPA